MACSNLNIDQLTACMNGDPGIGRMYISSYENILSSVVDTTGVILSGLTMLTGATKYFYRFELLQDVGASVDTPAVSISNGVSISVPSVKFKIANTNKDTLNIFNQMKTGRMVVIYENMDGILFAVGIKRGLFFSSGTAGTDEATFEGITVELKGKEKNGIYILSDALQSTFVSTYVVR